MKLLGKNNTLWVNNRITKQGLLVLAFCSVLGIGTFIAGRSIYGRMSAKKKRS